MTAISIAIIILNAAILVILFRSYKILCATNRLIAKLLTEGGL